MIGRRAAVALFAQILVVPAMAQPADQKPASPPAAAAPAATEPQTTTATYGDWVLRCVHTGDSASTTKICEVAETIRGGQNQAPMAEIALGRFNKVDPLRITAHLPSNISLPSVVKISYREAHGVELNWRRCAPVGCFADAALTDAETNIFQIQTEPGAIEFYNADGHSIRLPMSFKGLGQALDALMKE